MKHIAFLFLLLNSIFAVGQTNGDFEVWDSTYESSYRDILRIEYKVNDPIGGIVNNWYSDYWAKNGNGICRTTDSYSGKYALIIHNWYQYGRQTINFKDSINYRPKYLNGYFKYNAINNNGISKGIINVTLLKYNGISNDTIGFGSYIFDSTLSYKPFQVTINYATNVIPDSVIICAKNSDRNCVNAKICNLLYLDNLKFENEILGLDDFEIKPQFNFNPNPSEDNVVLKMPDSQNYTLRIYDAFGQINMTLLVYDNMKVSVANLENGMYYFTLVDNQGKSLTTEKIIKQ